MAIKVKLAAVLATCALFGATGCGGDISELGEKTNGDSGVSTPEAPSGASAAATTSAKKETKSSFNLAQLYGWQLDHQSELPQSNHGPYNKYGLVDVNLDDVPELLLTTVYKEVETDYYETLVIGYSPADQAAVTFKLIDQSTGKSFPSNLIQWGYRSGFGTGPGGKGLQSFGSNGAISHCAGGYWLNGPTLLDSYFCYNDTRADDLDQLVSGTSGDGNIVQYDISDRAPLSQLEQQAVNVAALAAAKPAVKGLTMNPDLPDGYTLRQNIMSGRVVSMTREQIGNYLGGYPGDPYLGDNTFLMMQFDQPLSVGGMRIEDVTGMVDDAKMLKLDASFKQYEGKNITVVAGVDGIHLPTDASVPAGQPRLTKMISVRVNN